MHFLVDFQDPRVFAVEQCTQRLSYSSGDLGENFPSWLAMPRKCLMCPIGNAPCMGWQKEHLAELSITLAFSSLSKTILRCVLCSSLVAPYTSMSSIRHTTPLGPDSTCDFLHWKCSGALVMPNGSLLN